MDLKQQILEALGLSKDEELKLAFQAKTEDGTIVVSTAEELEAGVDISVLTEDGTTILLPIGTYKLDTGVSFRVEEEGIVAEVIESETEEEDTADDLEDEKEEMEEEDESPAEKADWAKSYEELKDKVENLEDAGHRLEEQLGDKGEELAKEKKDKKEDTTSEGTTAGGGKEPVLELEEENKKLKEELAAKPAAANLNTNKFSSDGEIKELTKTELSNMSYQERFLYTINKRRNN